MDGMTDGKERFDGFYQYIQRQHKNERLVWNKFYFAFIEI